MLIEKEDIEALLLQIYHVYGYDFTGYSRASLLRRIDAFYSGSKLARFEQLREKILSNPVFFMKFVEEVTVNVTEMFRDASFYLALREKILPVLATYPFIRIWHAGCSTGEEVYSMAILLKEAGLLHKSILYGTDINADVIERARRGIFSASVMQQNSDNYRKAGGSHDFSVYYTANYNVAKLDESLNKRMVFSTHNLVSDASFNEFQLILCRNVLIYFDRSLQENVLKLFDKSLDSLGFLALGTKESIRFSAIAGHYKQVDIKEKIWRKNR